MGMLLCPLTEVPCLPCFSNVEIFRSDPSYSAAWTPSTRHKYNLYTAMHLVETLNIMQNTPFGTYILLAQIT